MGFMSRGTYLIIAVGVAIVVFLVATFFGPDIAAFADRMPGQVAASVSGLASLIVEPVKFVMLNPVVGAILTGLLWPVGLLWIFLLILLIMLTAAGQVQTDIDTNTPLNLP